MRTSSQGKLLVALVVGSFLTVANQFDVILRGSIHTSSVVHQRFCQPVQSLSGYKSTKLLSFT
jgi:hypothetical protein